MENHGTQHKTRFKKLREQVLAMKEIWTKDEAQYRGEFVNFDPIWSWTKPAQKPSPPVLLGGESGHTLQRVVDFCEGWFPRGRSPEMVINGMKDLRARAEAEPARAGGRRVGSHAAAGGGFLRGLVPARPLARDGDQWHEGSPRPRGERRARHEDDLDLSLR